MSYPTKVPVSHATKVPAAHTTNEFREPFDDDFMRDPYPIYAGLREESAAQEVVTPFGVKVWLVTRYADVRDLLADPRLRKNGATFLALSERHSVRRDERRGIGGEFRSAMLSADPPDHTRLRRLAAKAFTSTRIEKLRPEIEEVADTLLARVSAGQVVDIVGAYALPFSIQVICRLLGIPAEDEAKFQDWADWAARADISADELKRVRADITEFVGRLVEEKRANPGDDLVSALVAARDDGDKLSDTELVATVLLLVIAGHETTSRFIGNSILTLIANPDQARRLRADPALLPAAIEEFLRYEAPVTTSTYRYTIEPVRVGDVTIPANEIVFVVIGSANRDPAKFDRPDQLDVTRDTAGHLGFGHGIHRCLGAQLALAESETALRKLLERFQTWELAVRPDDVGWRVSTIIHGVNILPVRLS